MLRKIRRNYRRAVAFLLTMAMVLTNFAGNLHVAFAAGETENALFLVGGLELREAIRKAQEEGEVFKFSSLELKAGKRSIKNKYEKLLGTKEGKVYELDLEIDDSYALEGTSVEAFYNEGTEDVIFLFANESDMVVTFRVNIDGHETEPVTVSPNTANVEDEEEASYSEDYQAGDMVDDVQKKLGAEVVGPQEPPAGEPEEDIDFAAEPEEPGNDEIPEETKASESVGEEASAEETEEVSVAEEPEMPEISADEESEALADEESEAAETEAADEAETDAEEKSEIPGNEEELLSMSRHEAAIVSISLDNLENDEEEIIVIENETEELSEEESETEGEESETDSADAESPEETEETEPEKTETEAAQESAAEGDQEEIKDESQEETEEESREETAAESQTETASEAVETTDAEETEETMAEVTTKAPEESAEKVSDEEPAESREETDSDRVKDDANKLEGQLLEDDGTEVLGELKGKEFDTVTIRDHVNARAYKVAWEEIQAIIIEDEPDEVITGYAVDYLVNLPDAAKITGADMAEEGESLYFAVEPENGYEIAEVTANGEELKALEDKADLASASNWKGYSYIYVVENVAEDLVIDIQLEELAPIIAAAVYTAETEDAVFTVNVPDGAFEEAVDLRVEKITEEGEVKALADQAAEALKENQIVAGVLAYDVAFISKESGEEAEPMKTVEVGISYKAAVVPEEVDEKAVTGISVVHLPENESAQVVASAENGKETEFAFRADGFSPFVVTIQVNAEARTGENSWATLEEAIQKVQDGETIYLLADVEVSWIEVKDKNFKLDLNGKTIFGTTANYVLYLTSGEVILEDSSKEKTGGISHKSNVKGGGVVINGGTLKMEGGRIYGNETTTGGGVKVNASGVFEMNGGSISNNRATNGGGLYVLGRAEIKNGSAIEENTCVNYGGGVFVADSGRFTMENSEIYKNVNTSWYGGGVYNKGTVVMTDSTIGGNLTQTSGRFGGGVYNAGGSLELKGTQVSENSNGGIYIQSGDVHLEKVLIQENKGNQPALYIGGNGEFAAKSSTIYKNEADTTNIISILGGTENNVRSFEECTISNNKSTSKEYGSGNIICLPSSSYAWFNNCKIEGNVCEGVGGVGTINCSVTNLRISDSQIIGNEAKGAGAAGGIRQSSSQGEVTLENTVITENTGEGSGGILVTTGEFSLKSGAVYGNNSNDEPRDFRFSDRAKWKLMQASTMQNTLTLKEDYFKDYNYVWIGRDKDNSREMTFLKEITSNDAGVIDLQGRPKVDLNLQAAPMETREGIYISGNGDNTNDGLSPKTPVETLERALDALEEFNKGKPEEERANTIYVTGTIKIKEDTDWNGKGVILERDYSSPFTGVMVIVERGTLTLKDITLDGGYLKDMQSFGLITVSGGNLEINEGAVLQNSSKSLGNRFEGGGAVYISKGEVTLNEGGKIINNSSHNGGGVSVMSGGRLIMNGGEISGNTTDRGGDFGKRGYYTSGGGVFIAYNGEMEMNGGTISGNSSFDGGGISLGGPENDVFFKNDHPKFVMKGGAIDGNQSYSNGGGIFVQMNCVAEIHGGSITNNHNRALLTGVNFGGGGVYVNGGKSSRMDNGLLQLYNVEIGENQVAGARSAGGSDGAALAGCPTSKTKIYLTDGGVIHENGGANDIYLMSGNLSGGYSGTADLVISPFMLGGGAYHWANEKGEELPLNNGFIQVYGETFRAKTMVAGDEVTGLDEINTHITGNTSGNLNAPGAAIGSNGDVIIGSAPKEVVKVTVKKNWDDKGYENYRPKQVDVRILQGIADEKPVDVGFVRLSEENSWKATVKDLPKRDKEGNEFIYTVKEVPNGYDSAVTDHGKTGEGEAASFEFTVTNTPTYALTLKKEVEGPADNNEFEFKITLKSADGSLFSGEAEMTKADGSKGSLAFENGEARVTLKKGDTIQLENLEPGMTYEIEETNNGGADKTDVVIDGETADEAAGTIVLGGNVNVVVFTNTFNEAEPERGSLQVEKIVKGTAGETDRDFRFQISLGDDSVNGQFGGLKFENGVSEVFTLRHGQSKTITDLPAGIGYTVEELGAEELRNEGYTITSENEMGIIPAGDTAKASFTNSKDKEPTPPDEPTTPNEPTRPGGGGGSGGGGGGGGSTPPATPTTTIDEPTVPLANFPEQEPELIPLEEEEVPLASFLPKTGDARGMALWTLVFGGAGLGLLAAAFGLKKKRKEDQ